MNQETIERAARAVADAVKISLRPGGETMRLLDKGHTFHLNPDEARTAARAAIAAIHPTVSSVDELAALPEGTVLLDSGTEVLQLVEDGEGLQWSDSWANGCSVELPATVLYTPGGAA